MIMQSLWFLDIAGYLKVSTHFQVKKTVLHSTYQKCTKHLVTTELTYRSQQCVWYRRVFRTVLKRNTR